MSPRWAARGGPRLPAAVIRPGIRLLGRRVLNPELSWDVQRHRLGQLAAASPLPRGTTVAQATFGGVPADVLTAPGVSTARTVVHFHGGGYCVGSPALAHAWAARLSDQANCRVVLPDYRLAPAHPYPAALDDARAVLAAVRAQDGTGPVVLSGDSAGGGLALALTLALRDESGEPPAGCVLLSPWLDLAADRRSDPGLVRRDALLSPRWLEACAAAYAAAGHWSEQLVSPLRADLAGLPPLLVQAGSEELLAPDAQRLAAAASAAGTDVTYSLWPGLWHDFPLQAGLLAAADSAVDQAAWFVRSVTA
ncbi:MAG TPA: alpha/beta hydrolase fold domain-containing protein [Streptosporangiaceae bacterium]